MTTIDTPAPDDTTFSIDDWISGATRPETVIMLSSKGHEYGQFKALEVELLAAQKATDTAGDDRLVSVANTEPARIAAEMDALAKVIDKGRRPFRLRGLSEPDLKVMRAATKDLDEDETTAHLLSMCCIDPVLTPAKWGELRVALGEGQWAQAIKAANQVSFSESVDAPFCLAASIVLSAARSSMT
jgi:hypothetical protein